MFILFDEPNLKLKLKMNGVILLKKKKIFFLEIPCSESSWTIHLYWSLEEQSPHQPVCSEQGEFMVWGRRKLKISQKLVKYQLN